MKMLTAKVSKQKTKSAKAIAGGGYHGKRAKTGNSEGFRFEKALFQSHPEFSGEVRGHVIAPGSMLVVAESAIQGQRSRQEDPILEPFLSFLAQDIARSPEKILALDDALVERMQRLVGHLTVDPNEDLGDGSLL